MTKQKKAFFLLVVFSFLAGALLNNFFYSQLNSKKFVTADDLQFDEQEATIRAIKKVKPAVVSIIIYDYQEYIFENFNTGEKEIKRERINVGSGSGFLISSDGLILTNKHLFNGIDEKNGEYQVILNNDKEYYAQLIGKDALKDLAILKIFDKDLPFIEMADSEKLEVGQTVIAIGNSLGVYHNTVTKGIISGLGRNLFATDIRGVGETLENVIQTDAEINQGNSGGPLIDLEGKVLGINTAIDLSGTAIGFAIPINDAKPVIRSVKESGKISRPRLGVRYKMITQEIFKKNSLPRNEGAWITKGEDEEWAVSEGSAADKAGIVEGDIIFEVNAIKVDESNTLFSIIQKYKVGDKIGLKIQRGDKILIKIAELDDFNN